MVTPDRAFEIAATQDGLITRRQLKQCGYSESTIYRRACDGLWHQVLPGVFRLSGAPDNLRSRSRAVQLWMPDSILTGPSAAAAWRSGPWEGVSLGERPAVVSDRRTRRAVDVVRHPGLGAAVVDGLRVARRPHATVDLIRLLPLESARTVAFRAAQTGDLPPEALATAADRLRRYRGASQLRRVVADVMAGARSDGELRLMHLLRSAGVEGWDVNLVVPLPDGGTAVIDVAFPASRLAVEVDGLAHHSAGSAFQRDRTRHNQLELAGWRVLRFTWHDVAHRQAEVLRIILRALAA